MTDEEAEMVRLLSDRSGLSASDIVRHLIRLECGRQNLLGRKIVMKDAYKVEVRSGNRWVPSVGALEYPAALARAKALAAAGKHVHVVDVESGAVVKELHP